MVEKMKNNYQKMYQPRESLKNEDPKYRYLWKPIME